MAYRYTGQRNAAGWPAKKKFLFDAASQRRATKALETLYNAQERLTATATYLDAAELWLDADTKDAWAILQDAKKRVAEANDAAQRAAGGEAYGKVKGF